MNLERFQLPAEIEHIPSGLENIRRPIDESILTFPEHRIFAVRALIFMTRLLINGITFVIRNTRTSSDLDTRFTLVSGVRLAVPGPRQRLSNFPRRLIQPDVFHYSVFYVGQ